MDSMRTLLRRDLARSLSALPELDRLRAAWPVACGRAVADHSEIIAFENHTVQIHADDPLWLTHMLSMRPVLEAELRRIAAVDLTAIHFSLKPFPKENP